jgi:predicted nuclease of restriction endonuclease-like (RecB) superfamily
VRELRRQRDSGLFYRLALSKDMEEVLALARSGNQIEEPEDLIKSTYVLEFLNLPEKNYSEKTLEAELIKHLEEFLLELGRGFAFIGRQYRMTIDNHDYFADLVFYHVVLKRYVIIELKIGTVRHEDIGQMNLYLGYFAIDKTNEDDNPPIGIVLGADKDDVMVQYATYGMDSNLFVAKYQLHLPDVDELRNVLLNQLEKNKKEVGVDE